MIIVTGVTFKTRQHTLLGSLMGEGVFFQSSFGCSSEVDVTSVSVYVCVPKGEQSNHPFRSEKDHFSL